MSTASWIHELDLDAVRGWDGHVASAGFTDAGLARQIQELFHWPPIPAASPPALGRRRGPRDVPLEGASAAPAPNRTGPPCLHQRYTQFERPQDGCWLITTQTNDDTATIRGGPPAAGCDSLPPRGWSAVGSTE
jgi:hypothetical protein